MESSQNFDYAIKLADSAHHYGIWNSVPRPKGHQVGIKNISNKLETNHTSTNKSGGNDTRWDKEQLGKQGVNHSWDTNT